MKSQTNANTETNTFLKDSDLIFHMSKNGNVYSGGFAIDSSFMKNGVMSGGLYDADADTDADSDSVRGPAASSENIFTCGKFVVPPLWFHQEVHAPKISYSYDSDDDEPPVIDDTLYNKLLDMARHGGEAKHGEAKHREAKKRNTKKASAIGEKRKYTRKHRKPESESSM